MLAFGPGARGMLETMRSSMAAGLRAPTNQGFRTYAERGFSVFASFFLEKGRARLLLGRALRPGGFLAALTDGDIYGTLSTNGRVVRMETRVSK